MSCYVPSNRRTCEIIQVCLSDVSGITSREKYFLSFKCNYYFLRLCLNKCYVQIHTHTHTCIHYYYYFESATNGLRCQLGTVILLSLRLNCFHPFVVSSFPLFRPQCACTSFLFLHESFTIK